MMEPIRFETRKGLHVATGYNRLVQGGRGSFVEFEREHLKGSSFHCPDAEKWRNLPKWKDTVYFGLYESNDDCKALVYSQRKTVNYADYKIGCFYIDPVQLVWDWHTHGELATNIVPNVDQMLDGKDHINIYSNGQTQLGRMLTNFAHLPIALPDLGSFQSIEGLWYFLNVKGNEREELRKLWGIYAKQKGRELRGHDDWIPASEFQKIICNAIRIKIESYSDLMTMFVESNLPFRHYYVLNGTTVEPQEGSWVVDYIRNLREELR